MSDAHKPSEDGSRFEPKPARMLPDPAICRGKLSGFGDYVDCLVDKPYSCRYALSYPEPAQWDFDGGLKTEFALSEVDSDDLPGK